MRTRCFDHIDLRVKNMKVARKFYGKFLPQLGFVHESPGENFHTFYSAGGDKASEFFGFTEDKNHRPNGTRIAFWADSRGEVDRIAKIVREAGGKNLEGPEVCVDYSPGYYAFFFEDNLPGKLCRKVGRWATLQLIQLDPRLEWARSTPRRFPRSKHDIVGVRRT